MLVVISPSPAHVLIGGVRQRLEMSTQWLKSHEDRPTAVCLWSGEQVTALKEAF